MTAAWVVSKYTNQKLVYEGSRRRHGNREGVKFRTLQIQKWKHRGFANNDNSNVDLALDCS